MSKSLFAIIAETGSQWTVHFKAVDGARYITKRGYGPFPFDKYDIPVINFNNAGISKVLECIKWLDFNCIPEHHGEQPSNTLFPREECTVDDYLQWAVNCGIEVLNWQLSIV